MKNNNIFKNVKRSSAPAHSFIQFGLFSHFLYLCLILFIFLFYCLELFDISL